MIQTKKKLKMKLNNSVLHLITDYRLLITAMLPAALLSGCMGIYEGGFECPAGVGVGCKSISEVNDMVNQGELPRHSPNQLIQAKPEIWYSPHFKNQNAPCEGKFKSSSEKARPLDA